MKRQKKERTKGEKKTISTKGCGTLSNCDRKVSVIDCLDPIEKLFQTRLVN